MILSKSSTAIWWVSRSESLEREERIFCLSSCIAKWEVLGEVLGAGVDMANEGKEK